MSFPKNWDVQKYKKSTESEDVWILRRTFLERYRGKFDEEECCALAQLFINIEVLGCTYPQETMDRVGELGKSFASTVTKVRGTKLKRRTNASGYPEDLYEDWENFITEQQILEEERLKTAEEERKAALEALYKKIIVYNQDMYLTKLDFEKNKMGTFEEKMQQLDDKGNWIGKTVVNEHVLAEVRGFGKQAVKKELRTKTLEILNKNCFKLNKKEKPVGKESRQEAKKRTYQTGQHILSMLQLDVSGVLASKITALVDTVNCQIKIGTLVEDRSQNGWTGAEKLMKVDSVHTIDYEQNRLESNNVGFRMLQKLGWSGGSLGSNPYAHSDPVNLQMNVGRSGLGVQIDPEIKRSHSLQQRLQGPNIDVESYHLLFYNFKNSQLDYDLVFSAAFSAEETIFQTLAADYGLKTQTYGEGTSRRFVVKGIKSNSFMILYKVITGDPLITEYYDAQYPEIMH